tara:strand:+ start:684 stop:1427 length:744 start_codon:yes stop_codon:yes gene_type:complete
MAIDMKAMRAKLSALKNGGQRNVFWRPQDGDQTVRIVTPEDGDPFKDFYFHYNVGNASGFLCPKKNYGEECAVCNFVRALYDESTEESIKMAKSLTARQRFFSPVVVRGEEKDGVRIWGYGKTAYETLLNLVLNPDYGDITDVDEGTDLTVNYGKPAGASFPQTKIQPRRRTSALVENPEQLAELLNNIPEFEALFEKKNPADVEALLDAFLSDDEDAEARSSETVRYTKSESETSSVDEAFDQLLA